MHVEVLINSALLALGLALESFMVALANGLRNSNARILRGCVLALLFAACHAAALAIGFAAVRAIADNVALIERWLTWIAVTVLAMLGVKMIVEGIGTCRGHAVKTAKRTAEYFVQSAVASFDAFAVGLAVPNYSVVEVALCAGIISAVIFCFYFVGFTAGKKFGVRFSRYAALIGGLVFIGVAVEIAAGAV